MGEVFKLNHCYNMDCLPAMELFPDNYFDLAVVDPPYFSGPERRGFYGSKVSKIGVHRDYPVSPAWSKPEPEYFKELFRVCRHYIVWGCNYFDYQFPTGRIVWDKCNGNSSFSDCEIAATNLFSSVRMFRYMWSGMMQGKSITEGDTMQGNKSLNEKRIHPTQKPVALYDWIFKNYAEPGQKVLDTHLGSGSSRIAAKDPARAPAGESIEKRPAEVKDREEFGHWEMDTVYSGKKKSTVALLVLTERKTRNENIIVVPDRRAETTVRAINALERKLGAEKFGIIYKSITVDNGSEFALADQLEQSCITGDKRTKVYYCHPYSSWERGSNENVNGMIRRRHPKGTDFSKVTAEEIAATENWINSYPRKIFGYKSAGTMFRECLRELGLTA